jgi:uncharacterized membrane protein YfcA
MDASSYAVILVAVIVGSLVKGATGTGLPTVAIPVMASFLGVEQAVVIMALPTVVTNGWLMWIHRSQAGATRDLPSMIVAGLGGVVLGAWLLTNVSAQALSLGLAALIGTYVTVSLTRPLLTFSPAVTRWLSPPVGFIGGMLQGSTGIAGPAVATYLHGFRLQPGAYVFSLSAQFQVFALVSVVSYQRFGLYTSERMWWSVLVLIPMLLAMPIGVRLGRRLERRVFDRFVLVVLGVMGLKLIADGLGLWTFGVS